MHSPLLFFLILCSLSQIHGKGFYYNNQANDDINEICKDQKNWSVAPNPKDCLSFYLCSKNKAQLNKCKPNFYFDKFELICKPGNCPVPVIDACQSKDIIADEDDCTAYKKCVKGKFQKRSCRSGQYFNPTTKKCQTIVNDEHYKCSCVMPNFAVLRNDDDCSSYYICIDRKANNIKCPTGHYFYQNTGTCLPDNEHICLDNSNPNKPYEPLKCKISEWNHNTFRPIKNNCKKFYTCHNGHIIEMDCPKGFYFDSKLLICKLDTNKNCLLYPNEDTSEKVEEDKTIITWIKPLYEWINKWD